MKKPKALTPKQRRGIEKVLTRYARTFRRLKNAPKPKLVPFVTIPPGEFFAINGQPYLRLGSPNPTHNVIRCADWKVVQLRPGFNVIRITPAQANIMCHSLLQTEHLIESDRDQIAMDKLRLISFVRSKRKTKP